ncbi:hypothetical protein V6N13_047222 [Hibiscus sabdariffa]|uniref:Uncharacterized protein n=1 Tax=Hibiscus sabdariffa TaxID=183260 RepID=A0ABR2F3F3_9ROSI
MENLRAEWDRVEDEVPRQPLSACYIKTESIRSQIKNMGPVCKSRNKFNVSPWSPMPEDSDDFDERVLGDGSFSSSADETMWLSSGCISPFFKEHDQGLVSWLSTMASDLDSSSAVSDTDEPSFLVSSEAENIEDFDVDEPLFWPFERKIDWKSEGTWKHFIMSPRKNTVKITAPEENFHTNKSLRKSKHGSRKIKNGNSMPSRLRESTKVSARDQILPWKVAEDDFTSNEEVPIEMVVGLNEFDGHEGIDSELNEGVFLLDEALS